MRRLAGWRAASILLIAFAATVGLACLFHTGRSSTWGRRVGDDWVVRVSMPVSEVLPRKLKRSLVGPGWISIIDEAGAIRVRTNVSPKIIDRVRIGLTAEVVFDEFPDKALSGVVDEVSPVPGPSMPGNLGGVYTVQVKLDSDLPGLRPEMAGKVKLTLEGLDDRPGVPIQAVVHSRGFDSVAFRRGDGGFTWRHVTLGVPTDGFVEIVEGLEGGELVALDPQALIREEARPGSSNAVESLVSTKDPASIGGAIPRKYQAVMRRVPTLPRRPPSRGD